MESTVGVALGSLGAEVRALNLQTSFIEQIRDATDEGLGNIVDADLARQSAELTALQVQQQLSVQTLSVANQYMAADASRPVQLRLPAVWIFRMRRVGRPTLRHSSRPGQKWQQKQRPHLGALFFEGRNIPVDGSE